MPTNFRVYVDRGGNMPQLRRQRWECQSHPYYVRYINDHPVAYRGPQNVVATNVSKDKVYSYHLREWIPIAGLIAE